MIFPWNKRVRDFNLNYQEIISLLEKCEMQSIENLLWQPVNKKIEYLPIVFDMVMKFKKPISSNQNLSVHQKFKKGKYELIVFEIPWKNDDIKYSPLIFDKSTSTIVGIMLPFNELAEILSKNDSSHISELSLKWTNFIMTKRFGI